MFFVGVCRHYYRQFVGEQGISRLTVSVHLVAILFRFTHKIAGKVFDSLTTEYENASQKTGIFVFVGEQGIEP